MGSRDLNFIRISFSFFFLQCLPSFAYPQKEFVADAEKLKNGMRMVCGGWNDEVTHQKKNIEKPNR